MIQAQDWKELAQLHCSKFTVGPTKFKSYGDWQFTIRQMPKAAKNREQVIKNIAKYHHIKNNRLQRKVHPEIKKFEQALKQISIEILENGEAFMSNNNISGLIFCETLISDGNLSIIFAEDNNYYYYVYYMTS